jgi:hypothetical protein
MTSRKELGVLSRAETNPHDPDLARQGVKSMRWTVEQVQSTHDDRFAGSGFNICNRHGRPIITFGYLTDREARDAREKMVAALGNAKFVG